MKPSMPAPSERTPIVPTTLRSFFALIVHSPEEAGAAVATA